MKSKQVIKDLGKVIDAIGESQYNPDDIAIVISIDGKLVSLTYKDLEDQIK
jgi:hypothetical protein